MTAQLDLKHKTDWASLYLHAFSFQLTHWLSMQYVLRLAAKNMEYGKTGMLCRFKIQSTATTNTYVINQKQ